MDFFATKTKSGSEICKDLPPHFHSDNNSKNQLLDNSLRPQLSQSLLERERHFKRIYSATFETCREQTARSHAYRNRFKLGQHLDIGQKFLYENHRQDVSKSQKLQQRRLGPFTIIKRITNTTYQKKDDDNPTNTKTVKRNHLVEYYPKEKTLPPMIEEYVPIDRRHDYFFERFLEQRIQKLNNPEKPGMEDSLPFPIEPLRAAPTTLPRKRVRNTSSDSGVNSPHVLSPAMPAIPDNSLPYLMPSTSRMNLPGGPLTPIQQFIHNSCKSKNKEPNTIVPNLIILTHSRCCALAPSKATNSNLLLPFSLTLPNLFLLVFYTFAVFFCQHLTFFTLQLTMPQCHKFYPNCIWRLPPEWFGLFFNSALLTKVHWRYATHIVRVCVSPLFPINPQLHCSKSNLQVKFCSRAMGTLHDLQCHHSLTNNDPLLEELRLYLPTRFPSHTFDYIAYESSDNESVRSIDSSVSAFLSDDWT